MRTVTVTGRIVIVTATTEGSSQWDVGGSVV